MTIIEALKCGKYGLRVSNGNRWLVVEDIEWVVYERLPSKKTTTEVIRTLNERAAVQELLK
jgi:hypothetical protein